MVSETLLVLTLALQLSGALAPAAAPACEATQPPHEGSQATVASGARSKIASKRVNAERLLADARALSADEMEGRASGTPGGARARAYIARRFKETGIRPLFGDEFEQPFEMKARRAGEKRAGVNLVGYVRGSKEPGRFIVVTAHYDHLGVKGGQIYNGADDNASGVAALVALASHFNRERPRHSVVFAALDAEEEGLQGAYALVEKLTNERRDVALNVNMDMVGHSERGELYAAGTFHTPSLKPTLESVAARAPVRLLFGHDRPEQKRDDWTSQSDHFAFHRVGLPFVYFGVEDHKDYHRPTDDFDTLTPDFFVGAVETIIDALGALDENLSRAATKRK